MHDKHRLQVEISHHARRNLRMLAAMAKKPMAGFLDEMLTKHASAVARQALGEGHDELFEALFVDEPPDQTTSQEAGRGIANG